jgi:TPR repeat protein
MKYIVALVVLLITGVAHGQTADSLNNLSKEFLSKSDTRDATPLLKQAAELGQPEAQYNYGVCYQQGIEVETNDSIANEWFLKSAKQGWVDAQFKISYSYALGRGCSKDLAQAFYWSVKCAEQGDPECMFNVVNCYHDGSGTAQNSDSMLIWAVRLGSHHEVENLQLSSMITSARLNLAIMYRDGDHVQKDFVNSYMWFLIYNESKRDFSIIQQQKNIDAIKDLENKMSEEDKDKARIAAARQLNRKLTNLANLYKQDM